MIQDGNSVALGNGNELRSTYQQLQMSTYLELGLIHDSTDVDRLGGVAQAGAESQGVVLIGGMRLDGVVQVVGDGGPVREDERVPSTIDQRTNDAAEHALDDGLHMATEAPQPGRAVSVMRLEKANCRLLLLRKLKAFVMMVLLKLNKFEVTYGSLRLGACRRMSSRNLALEQKNRDFSGLLLTLRTLKRKQRMAATITS